MMFLASIPSISALSRPAPGIPPACAYTFTMVTVGTAVVSGAVFFVSFIVFGLGFLPVGPHQENLPSLYFALRECDLFCILRRVLCGGRWFRGGKRSGYLVVGGMLGVGFGLRSCLFLYLLTHFLQGSTFVLTTPSPYGPIV